MKNSLFYAPCPKFQPNKFNEIFFLQGRFVFEVFRHFTNHIRNLVVDGWTAMSKFFNKWYVVETLFFTTLPWSISSFKGRSNGLLKHCCSVLMSWKLNATSFLSLWLLYYVRTWWPVGNLFLRRRRLRTTSEWLVNFSLR